MIQVFEKLSSEEILTLSVGELARKFSCSRRHLNRLFHQHFGFSVASLRMEMRLLKAVSLLRDPDMKIINVAEGCGFNHLGLFNTCFKRRFGRSPGEWRKTNGNVAIPQSAQSSFATHLRSKGLGSWNGSGESHAHSSVPQPSAREPDVTILVKTNGESSEGKTPRVSATRKSRDRIRQPSAI
jgi:AraC-like DNA-binding protein